MRFDAVVDDAVVDDAVVDAVVLAGGAATRLGGVDKPQLVVGGATLLDRVLLAVQAARTVAVAGPVRPTAFDVRWVREEPPGGGPVAALAAALPLLPLPHAPVVLTLAADLPWIAAAVPRLVAAAPADGVAVLVDESGRRNHLAAAWRTATLRAAMGRVGPVHGASMRALTEGVAVVELADPDGAGRDCDTPADLARARRHP